MHIPGVLLQYCTFCITVACIGRSILRGGGIFMYLCLHTLKTIKWCRAQVYQYAPLPYLLIFLCPPPYLLIFLCHCCIINSLSFTWHYFYQTTVDCRKNEKIFKVLVLGDIGTGKTSFIRRYVSQQFFIHYKATVSLL